MKKSILWVGGIILLGLIIALILIFSLRKPTYEVSFVSDGVEILEAVEVKEDGTIKEPEIPVKEGYDFVGWYSKSEKFDFATKITEDITLEAKWVKAGSELYTITFDTKGGDVISSIEVEDNMTVTNLPTPKKDGYTFVGWFDGNKEVTSTTKITKDMTLIAKWEKEETTKTKRKTSKKTTTKTTTTKATTATTTVKKDVLSYEWVPLKDDTAGYFTLYITKNGDRVAGTCDITTNSGKTVTKDIPVSGYVTIKSTIDKITNIIVK